MHGPILDEQSMLKLYHRLEMFYVCNTVKYISLQESFSKKNIFPQKIIDSFAQKIE